MAALELCFLVCLVSADINVVFFCLFHLFETGSHFVALAILELSRSTHLALNSQKYTCLCIPNA